MKKYLLACSVLLSRVSGPSRLFHSIPTKPIFWYALAVTFKPLIPLRATGSLSITLPSPSAEHAGEMHNMALKA